MPRFLLLFLLLLPACQQSTKSPQAWKPNTLPGPEEPPGIFESYSATDDAELANTWARSFDMSGVSFDDKRTATLVTPRHVVMAAHYTRKPGSRVVFHDRNGKRLERKLVTTRKVLGDVAVGLLDEEVPSRFKVYPLIHRSTTPEQILGRLAAVTDQNRRIFFHRIKKFRQSMIVFGYDAPTTVGWGKKLVSGDSGNPSFLPVGNDLALIETHTGGGAGVGPYYGNPELQDKLQDRITELAPGYLLRFRKL